jgi:competence protein ComEC
VAIAVHLTVADPRTCGPRHAGIAMRAPLPILPYVLGAFVAGAILLQRQAVLPDAALCAAGAAAAAVAGALLRFGPVRLLRPRLAGCVRHAGSALVIFAAALLGFAYAAWRADVRLAIALPPEWEGEDIALVGVVDDLPQVTDRGLRFAFAVERIETPHAIVPRRLSLAWYGQRQKGGATDEVPELAAGERWRLIVRLKRPHGNVNPGGFDLEAWLLENGLRATGYVRRDAANARLADFAGRASDHLQRARAAVRSRILAALPAAR